MKKKKFDFSGYATKFDVKCTDGRVIKSGAFKHNDGLKVPLVYQHLHTDVGNVLGYAILEHRENDGVYAYCTFNETESGRNGKILVQHGDIDSLSIHANQLKQKGNDVYHGSIKELSLVLAGANPGAVIDNIEFSHEDGDSYYDESEAIIYSGQSFKHDTTDDVDEDDEDEDEVNHADEETVRDVFNTLSDKQKNVVYIMMAEAMSKDSGETKHSDMGGSEMKKNVFDNKDVDENKNGTTLTHAQFAEIMTTAQKIGSFKEAVIQHAADYGIEDIDVLFPEARAIRKDPDWIERDTTWVSGILNGTNKSPFSRIRSVTADMDFDTARAKGYIKGNEKKETYFKVAKRDTTPGTIYVKQKIDRDDVIDVTDFNIVAMIRRQLRVLLNEELASSILVGDGRELDDPYKVDETKVRPIWKEADLYAVKELLVSYDDVDGIDYPSLVEEIAMTGENYEGSGSPTFYTTYAHHMKMLWIKDADGRRIYTSDAELTAALGVSSIKEIPKLKNLTRTLDDDSVRTLVGIKINLKDYTVGADKGGEIANFDDFDIDFNQHKYLMETRVSGALTKPKSAQIFEIETTPAP